MKGFTLIETIIYIALLSVLMFVAVQALISVEDSTRYENKEAVDAEEGAFAIAKIEYAMQHHQEAMITLSADQIFYGDVPLTSRNVKVADLTFTTLRNNAGDVIGKQASFTLDGEVFETQEYYSL